MSIVDALTGILRWFGGIGDKVMIQAENFDFNAMIGRIKGIIFWVREQIGAVGTMIGTIDPNIRKLGCLVIATALFISAAKRLVSNVVSVILALIGIFLVLHVLGFA